MSGKQVSHYLAAFGVLLAVGIAVNSCKEKPTSYVIDEEEIQLYINSSDVGNWLFPKSGLITDDPYVLSYDSDAVYRDHVDSVHRQIVVNIPTKVLAQQSENVYGSKHSYIQDFGPPYYLTQDAEATVEDRYYVTTDRVAGSDTTTYTAVRYLTRFGYFIKAGSDAEAFSGWLLVGFSGVKYVNNNRVYDPTYIRRPGGTQFEAYSAVRYHPMSSIMIDQTSSQWDTIDVNWETDQAYIPLFGINSVDTLETDVPIALTVTPDAPIRTIAFQNGNTFDFRNMLSNGTTGDTAYVTIKTPSIQRWGVLYFQGFVKQTGDTTTYPPFNTLQLRNWTIPFHVLH
jgi:hypothetical protein